MKRAVLFFGAAALLLALAGCSPSGPNDALKSGFVSPPPSSRPGVYWYFMDGNLSREGITADLESMKKAGLGWVLFLEVNVGVPRGKVDFLSDEWQDLFVHAVRECERLGIRLILGSGPGWAGSGGPWVTPAGSMLHLVTGRTDMTGPGPFRGKLPVPGPRTPFFGEWTLTPELKAKRDAWYEDAAVLAFPTPAAEATIPLLDDKALYRRAPFTSQPGVPPRLPDPPAFDGKPGAAVDAGSIIDLTGRLRPDGTLDWLVPPGRWTILRFAARNNGAVTRPAPLPGLGFECDKFDASALDAHYKAYVGRLLRRTGRRAGADAASSGGGWTMLHIDSWEMGSQNWSPGFRDEFRKRRGYDPLPFLPAYAGTVVGSLEQSERFLWDVRRTASELVVEKHAERFKELGRREGFALSIEPYDMNPSADLDLGAAADVPQGEFWSEGHGFNSSFSVIEAVSSAHTTGAPIVAAESFTADSSEAWKKYPGNMKDQTDWAFAMGLNRLLFHTFAHQPFGARLKPGMTMGPYGVHWDRNQTWWPLADAYHLYISRCQYLLARGRPVADILYLAPEGAPQVFRAPASALEGSAVLPDKRGYSFDGCSPAVLIRNASVENGRIVFPGGASYRLLVLPDVGAMTPELLEKIASLVRAGAAVVGRPPDRSPSLEGRPACDARVAALAREIWGGAGPKEGATERVLGLGRVFRSGGTAPARQSGPVDTLTEVLYPEYSVTAALLGKLGVKPDFTSSPGSLRYSHRSLPGREVYFISNRTAAAVEETCTFRDGTGSAELWDAVTGETRPFRHIAMIEGGAEAGVKLGPHQSLFVVFDTSGRKAAARKTVTSAGTDVPDFPERVPFMTIEGPWNVAFDPAWGGPAGVVFDRLEDWTKRPEEGIRHYSGTAVYSTTFDLPDGAAAGPDDGLYLDLGEVRHMARVRLNGRELGTVWTAPPLLKLDGPLRKKGNRLEIETANLWTNRLIGDESEPWDGPADGKWPAWLLDGTPRPTGRFAFAPIRPYKAGDALEPSGLLGPVRIVR